MRSAGIPSAEAPGRRAAVLTGSRRRRRASTVLLIGLACATHLSAGIASAASPPTLPTIERQVMCVSCKIPLNVAESPQADRERAYIQRLIGEGRSEAQIKQALVDQYGPSVLGLPGAHGFNLAVYLVPLGVVLALVALLAVMLARWRRRPGRGPGPGGRPPALDAADATRLDADLARFP